MEQRCGSGGNQIPKRGVLWVELVSERLIFVSDRRCAGDSSSMPLFITLINRETVQLCGFGRTWVLVRDQPCAFSNEHEQQESSGNLRVSEPLAIEKSAHAEASVLPCRGAIGKW